MNYKFVQRTYFRRVMQNMCQFRGGFRREGAKLGVSIVGANNVATG